MKTTEKKKTFDSVRMMREIRDRISAETKDMTFAELKTYLEKHLKGRESVSKLAKG